MVDRYDSVLVLGIGGGAGRIVQELAKRDLGAWLRIAMVDTDVRDLDYEGGILQIPLGDDWTAGQGCGGDVLTGEHVTAQRIDDLRELFCDAELTIIVSCLGGGVGSGGVQILNRLLAEEDSLGFSVVTLPFEFEGDAKVRRAKQALEGLYRHDDMVIALSNDTASISVPSNTPFNETLDLINARIVDAVTGLASILRCRDGISVDVASLRRLLGECPAACSLGTATVNVSEGCKTAVTKTLEDPLLGGEDILGNAHMVLVTLTGGPGLKLTEIQATIDELRSRLAPSIRTLVAASPLNEQAEGTLRIVLLAIQYQRPNEQMPRSELSALDYGELTLRLTPGDAYLPVPTNDVTGILGIFGGSTPTIYEGENLDMPTFMRKGVTIQQIVESIYEAAEE